MLRKSEVMFRQENSLAFTAAETEYLRRFYAFRTDISRNKPLGAPVHWPQITCELLLRQSSL